MQESVRLASKIEPFPVEQLRHQSGLGQKPRDFRGPKCERRSRGFVAPIAESRTDLARSHTPSEPGREIVPFAARNADVHGVIPDRSIPAITQRRTFDEIYVSPCEYGSFVRG